MLRLPCAGCPFFARAPVSTLLTILAALPAAGQDPASSVPGGQAGADDEAAWVVDLESTSHIVRDKEDRLLVGWALGNFQFRALYANLDPDFRPDQTRLGLSVAYRLGAHRLEVLARVSEREADDDQLAALAWSFDLGGGRLGLEAAAGTADLRDEGFLVSSAREEDQLHGRLYYRTGGGLELSAFTTSAGTFDMVRPVGDLLERLPRSELAGIETLADRYPDEERVEDASGARVAYRTQRFSGAVYAKAGEQWIRGIPTPDDMTGFGGELSYRGERLDLAFELDLRSLDPGGGFETIERGRLLVDYGQSFGAVRLGLGSYVQGQSSELGDLVDDYETAGLALRLSRESAGARTLGLWGMIEDDAPDFHKVARLAFFWQGGEDELGLGVRADQVGRDRFEETDIGPFAYIRRPLASPGSLFDAHVGFVGDEVFGRVLLRITR